MAAETLERKADRKARKHAKSSKGKPNWPLGFKDKNWPFAFAANVNDGRIELWAGNPDREDD